MFLGNYLSGGPMTLKIRWGHVSENGGCMFLRNFPSPGGMTLKIRWGHVSENLTAKWGHVSENSHLSSLHPRIAIAVKTIIKNIAL